MVGNGKKRSHDHGTVKRYRFQGAQCAQTLGDSSTAKFVGYRVLNKLMMVWLHFFV